MHRHNLIRRCVVVAATALIVLLPAAAVASPTAPSAPTNLVASAGDAIALLSWDEAQATVAPIDHYKIYRSRPCRTSDFSLIAESEGTTFEDRDVTNGLSYFYSVSAVNSLDEEGPRSDRAVATPDTPSAGRPGCPLNIGASVNKTGRWGHWAETTLQWQAPATEAGSPILRYRIYRAEGADAPLKQIGVVSADTFSYVDGHTNVDSEKCFVYEVRAENANGEGAGSRTAGGPCDVFNPDGGGSV